MATPTRFPPVLDRHDRGSLVERELLHSLDWLLSLRWFAGAAVLVFTPLAVLVFRAPLPTALLTSAGFTILAYNALLWLILQWMRRAHRDEMARFEMFARLQIALDWIAMAALIAMSGGAESPTSIFFLFHITIASLLLPHHLGFLYVSMAPVLVATIALLEYVGILPHVPIIQPPRFRDPYFVGASIAFFTIACYVMAYCCMAIARRLRRREDELGSLYAGVRDITSTLELPAVLDHIVEAAASVLRCRAAAIRLIDPYRTQVEFAASWGLSAAYLEDVPEEFSRSRLDQETIRDGVVHVPDVQRDDRVWRQSRIRDEGIACMLSVAIHGRAGAIGVLRAYGAPGHRFSDEDAAYLKTVAAQGAVAIEHAKAYQMLADLDRDKSRFLRMTTHELRSPVRVTESLLMTLADGYAGPLGPDQAELVRRAQRRLATLHALIDDLLDLAAGKAGLAPHQPCVFDLRDVICDVVERFQPVAREKGIQLSCAGPARPLEVWGDPADLERVVVNLVSNAVKYTPRGSVSVALSEESGRVRLEVSDTGIGIPEDAMPQLFGEFFRARNAKKIEEAGTGLGLSIVKQLVERHGGRISVDSREGEGSKFIVELERAQTGASRPSPA